MKEIEKILGITPNLNNIENNKNTIPEIYQEEVEKTDVELVRENLIGVINKANDAATYASLIAKDKEDARSFEALNGILNTIADTSLKLLNVHIKTSKIVEDDKKINQNINNAIIFNGTSSDLKKFIENNNLDVIEQKGGD